MNDQHVQGIAISSTPLMFYGNSQGKYLAPYIVYKAEHKFLHRKWSRICSLQLHQKWLTRWSIIQGLGSVAFFLIGIKKLAGPKILFGYKISSHISINVIQFLYSIIIYFVCLSYNATYLTQSLYVAFFDPMKRFCCSILLK